ncbi:MAG: hypothetical protein ABWK00_02620 [Desulfurococcaceae archaeon]
MIPAIQRLTSFEFVRLVPRADLDSLLAAGVLQATLSEHEIDVAINLDPKAALDARDEQSLLINLPAPRGRGLAQIESPQDSSVTANVISSLEEFFAVSTWHKILAMIAGHYGGLDLGKEGFRGVEKAILNELLTTGNIQQRMGFRFWGLERLPLASAMARTAIPFMAGLTGSRDACMKVIARVARDKDPGKVRAEDIGLESGQDVAKKFVDALNDAINLPDEQRKRALLRLIGSKYSFTVDDKPLDLSEMMGALVTYASIDVRGPTRVPLLALDKALSFVVLLKFEDVIDEVAGDVGMLTNYLAGQGVLRPKALKRPELLIEALKSVGLVNPKRPVVIEVDGRNLTSLAELIRTGVDPETAYSSCDEVQLCEVREHGGVVKA